MMMDDSLGELRLALVQADLRWQDPAANCEHLSGLVAGVEADVVVLPEMFATGFTMQPEQCAIGPDDPVLAWLQTTAHTLGAAVVGSVAYAEPGSPPSYRNRLFVQLPDGQRHHYDKRHLFRMAGEHEVYTPGSQHLQVGWRGWQLAPLVCYDLRFPVWSRTRSFAAQPYDVLVYVANWPARRSHHWRRLLAARAIENQCYCVGVNRTGTDGNGITYDGQTLAYDYHGDPLHAAFTGERVQVVTLHRAQLLEYREKFPAWRDADAFDLKD
jgi:predicted amidohydrolase